MLIPSQRSDAGTFGSATEMTNKNSKNKTIHKNKPYNDKYIYKENKEIHKRKKITEH